jgi:hypothetical protein
MALKARLLTLLIAVLATLAAASSAAAVGWVTGAPLSPGDRLAAQPQLVVTPDGERVVAWIQQLPSHAVENVSVRVAPPGGDFGPAQAFPGAPDSLQLGVGTDGTIALTWVDTAAHVLEAARRIPGESQFTLASPLAVTPGELPTAPHLAMNGSDVFIAFGSITADQSASSIWAARLGPQDNTLRLQPGMATGGALDHVSFGRTGDGHFLGVPRIALDNGIEYVTWRESVNRVDNNAKGLSTVKVALRSLAGLFGAPQTVETVQSTLSDLAPTTSPRIVGGAGHAYVIWRREPTNQLAFEDLEHIAAPQTIAVDPDFADISAAVDGSGALAIAGDGSPAVPNVFSVSASITPAGHPAAPAGHLTPGVSSRLLDGFAVASDGTSLALANRASGASGGAVQVQAMLRPPGGSFGPSEEVSGPRDRGSNQLHAAAAAVAPGGRAWALWAAEDATGASNSRLFLSERDATAPTFTSLAVPARVQAGQRVSMSATATDTQAGNVELSWDFGDGSTSGGTSVTHVFGAPGAAALTVTATDGAGNSITQTRVVAVGPAGPPADRTPPVIKRLSLTRASFMTGSRGTAFRLVLSERSVMAIVIRHGHSLRGTLVRRGAGPGAATVRFGGRLGGVALAPGSYSATVIAIDGFGNRSKPRVVRFTVVHR